MFEKFNEYYNLILESFSPTDYIIKKLPSYLPSSIYDLRNTTDKDTRLGSDLYNYVFPLDFQFNYLNRQILCDATIYSYKNYTAYRAYIENKPQPFRQPALKTIKLSDYSDDQTFIDMCLDFSNSSGISPKELTSKNIETILKRLPRESVDNLTKHLEQRKIDIKITVKEKESDGYIKILGFNTRNDFEQGVMGAYKERIQSIQQLGAFISKTLGDNGNGGNRERPPVPVSPNSKLVGV
jgi:hypothetical protein